MASCSSRPTTRETDAGAIAQRLASAWTRRPEVAKGPHDVASHRPLERDERPGFAREIFLGAVGLEENGGALQRDHEVSGRV